MNLSPLIDHTYLKEDIAASKGDSFFETLCKQAVSHGFAGVCVRATWVPTVKKFLTGTPQKVISVVAFPAGSDPLEAKLKECGQALNDGAHEIDVVMNFRAWIANPLAKELEREIRALVALTRPTGALLKVILETGALNPDLIVLACKSIQSAGADFVKTSTGFGPGGATVDTVSLMRKTVGPAFGVKASGGIRDRATAIAMVQAGANRIGTSSGVTIVSEDLTDSQGGDRNTGWPGESSGSY